MQNSLLFHFISFFVIYVMKHHASLQDCGGGSIHLSLCVGKERKGPGVCLPAFVAEIDLR